MPSLKDLKCSIELSDSQQILQEFGTTYGDGLVETFVPVPSKPQPFSVHLTSERFIASGIAMYGAYTHQEPEPDPRQDLN